jgi:hypothetical protein
MKSDMENRDWINDYKALKQVSKANPFTVPAGYFDSLGDRIAALKNFTTFKESHPESGFTAPGGYFDELSANIQSRIALDNTIAGADGFTVPEEYFDELSSNIQSRIAIEEAFVDTEHGFAVPEGYFDDLTLNIQSRIAIEEALAGADNSFAVPEGYFDELSANIQSRIAIEEALAGAEEGFAVPEGYFDELSANIQSRIAVEEALAETGNGFTVPEGYFETLNESILAETAEAGQEAKVVPINRNKGVVRKLFRSTAFKYATAACFAMALGGGILLFQSPDADSAHKNSFLHKQLSNVPVSDIKSYLELNVDAGDTQQTVTSQGTTVDDADLKNALKNYADSVQ